MTGASARPVPHSRHDHGGNHSRRSGSSASLIVVPGSPGCLTGRRFPRSRSDRSRGFLIRAVRRRRLRRRQRMPARTPLQQLHPRRQPGDHPVRLSQPRRQLIMRQRRQLLRTGNTGRIGHSRQSSSSPPASQPPATTCRATTPGRGGLARYAGLRRCHQRWLAAGGAPG